MIDKMLQKTGVGIALLFMVTSLSYVNTLSLQYMYDNNWLLDTIFGIISAIAFSIVTILVMRLSKKNWLKHVFPVFDALLMFCGFNLKHWDDLFDNPVRFAMSIFMSVFSGLITYSLGQINAEQHSGANAESKIVLLQQNATDFQTKLQQAESKINALQLNLLEFKPGYLLYERSRILKKRIENRTERDLVILAECESLNN